jgi:DNA-binding PadR family transcriptional regulator
LLHRLERVGHVESGWGQPDSGRKREYYRITEQGRAGEAAQHRAWSAIVDTLSNVWQDSFTVTPLRPAMEGA